MTVVIEIPKWHPVRINQMMGVHWSKGYKLKKVDKDIVIWHSKGKPLATSKRRISFHIIMKKGQRAGDPDAYLKSLLDALVHARMLRDDSDKWCQIGDITFTRDPKGWGTEITLEDIE